MCPKIHVTEHYKRYPCGIELWRWALIQPTVATDPTRDPYKRCAGIFFMGTPTQIFIPFFSRATNHHIHPPFLQEWISHLFTWFESNFEPIPVEHSLKLRFSPQFHHRCYSDVRHPGLSVECFSHSSKDVPDRAAPPPTGGWGPGSAIAVYTLRWWEEKWTGG